VFSIGDINISLVLTWLLKKQPITFSASTLTLHNPDLPCKGQTVKGIIILYQTLQNYIYVNADFDIIEKALSRR
jgi:hypothetical protein